MTFTMKERSLMSDESRGLTAYQGSQGGRSAPRQVFFAALLEKSRLRAALAAVQADIDAAIPALSHDDLQELQT